MKNSEEKRIFVYKLVTDNGGAPCVHEGLLSLAICKPAIRASAHIGDLVFGFGGKPLVGRLIYIAVVTEKECNGDYYSQQKHLRRPDCIYAWKNGKLHLKKGAKFHAEGLQAYKDVGTAPTYKKGAVLLSRDFRYLGREGDDSYQHSYRAITACLDCLRQGHRVNHSPALHEELLKLKDEIWKKSRAKRVGDPTHSD